MQVDQIGEAYPEGLQDSTHFGDFLEEQVANIFWTYIAPDAVPGGI
jgi:hypothetical protein